VIAVVKDLPPVVRAMCQADIVSVLEIENETYDFPWSAGIFRDCLLAGYTALVLDLDGDVVGYSIMSVAAGEAHLLNICIAKSLRGGGVGSRLLTEMLSRARVYRATRIFLEVRPSNSPALELYSKTGFKTLGVRQRYYKAKDGNEDAVVLVYCFDDDDEFAN
jgi:ribosomal-protein-alanine N-acetyltransferase